MKFQFTWQHLSIKRASTNGAGTASPMELYKVFIQIFNSFFSIYLHKPIPAYEENHFNIQYSQYNLHSLSN